MGRELTVPSRPQRIISLVPSQTELLFDLGLAAVIVGRTKFCLHPTAKVRQKPSVGGTKQFRFDLIDQLQPDLIIGNKEENYQAGIERLAAQYPVWMSDITNLAQALAMIRQVGKLVDRKGPAEQLAAAIEKEFATLPRLSRPRRVGYFIWQNPYMVAGQSTFIHDMLDRCGFVNPFAEEGSGRYPELTPDQIRAANLDLILLASEPFPFAEKHRQMFLTQFDCPVHLVDGEMFSWYGSRLLLAAAYLQQLILGLEGIAHPMCS
ncbi:MAG: ABC transporter substrate-binding protein [Anaerolineae bacterium]|nr:ABC transporter substrate-binding protein [Anaerolineae bacterium]